MEKKLNEKFVKFEYEFEGEKYVYTSHQEECLHVFLFDLFKWKVFCNAHPSEIYPIVRQVVETAIARGFNLDKFIKYNYDDIKDCLEGTARDEWFEEMFECESCHRVYHKDERDEDWNDTCISCAYEIRNSQ